MTPLVKGMVLGAVQVAMVLSLGAKLLVDRSSLPRVWARTAPFDPDLAIRGRYVSLAVEVEPRGFESGVIYVGARLSVQDGKLVATPGGSEMLNVTRGTLAQPVAFFIPEHVPDPSRRAAGEELWVELTIPPKGPPRPIRLGVKKDGALTPIDSGY
jgi:hypothetical protein